VASAWTLVPSRNTAHGDEGKREVVVAVMGELFALLVNGDETTNGGGHFLVP
jgi:hypothetical protein